jgi:hypothetical protein
MMETLTKEIGSPERIRLRKPEAPSPVTSVIPKDKGIDDRDFKLVVSLGLFGLPLPGPMDFYRHSKIMTNARKWDFLRPGLHRAADPWKEIFKKAAESEYADPSWMARPRAAAPEDSRSGLPTDCVWRDQDSLAAYVHALLAYFTSDRNRAGVAAAILKTWARVSSGQTGFQRCHESDWALLALSGASQILLRFDPAWAEAELKTFSPVLKRVSLGR